MTERSFIHSKHRAAYLGAVLYFLSGSFGRADDAIPPNDRAQLIVGSLRGLEAWRYDGGGKRIISKIVALKPRWLDAGVVLVLMAI
ncbi:MAG: hypothetical protein SF187_29865 [Deltaproteobacteria bacterium]|nr:hypothetical protein [Deltaproteobacteria bacterium]